MPRSRGRGQVVLASAVPTPRDCSNGMPLGAVLVTPGIERTRRPGEHDDFAAVLALVRVGEDFDVQSGQGRVVLSGRTRERFECRGQATSLFLEVGVRTPHTDYLEGIDGRDGISLQCSDIPVARLRLNSSVFAF